MRAFLGLLGLLSLVPACSCGGTTVLDAGLDAGSDGGRADAPGDAGVDVGLDAGGDAGEQDAGGMDAGVDAGDLDAGSDAGDPDAGELDAGADAGEPDAGPRYDCGAFTDASGWTVRSGYRAVVIADATDGISQPVALTVAEGAYGAMLYVVSSGADAVHRVDVATGTTSVFTGGATWGTIAPALLTTIAWDAAGVLDGALYVGDQGSDGDADSAIYRLAADGTPTLAVRAPGAGLDDVYAMAFGAPGTAYAPGLYLGGDTDGAGVDWGVFDGTSTSSFSEVAGVEGAAFDPTGLYGGTLWAARPAGGGYAGDGSVTPLSPTGVAGTPIAVDPGVHAVTFSERGAFGARMYAVSWSTGTLYEIAPDGALTTLASGLMLSNYDGNALDVSSDGEVLFVADRDANRVVCIEPL